MPARMLEVGVPVGTDEGISVRIGARVGAEHGYVAKASLRAMVPRRGFGLKLNKISREAASAASAPVLQ